MAITPQEFFTKNLKWVTLILLLLLVFKSMQSCNRNMKLTISDKQYIHIIDSIEKKYNGYYKQSQDSIKELNFELKFANEHANSANERANAVSSAVQSMKQNINLNIKGIPMDTISNKRK